MRKFVLAAVFAASVPLVALTPAVARADSASMYNLFVLGDMNMKSSDVQGRVAVGGNAKLDSYSVGANAPANTVNLVVGGNLTAGVSGGGSTHGLTVVGGTATYKNWSSAGLQPTGTPLPVDFGAEAIRLDALTDVLADYDTTGTVGTVPWGGQFTVDATDPGLNVFDITGKALGTSNTFTIDLHNSGQTVLINVDGTADHFSGGLNIIGGDASQVLWNFSDATTLSFSGIGMLGSVLAPNADYQGGSGVLTGQLIVKDFTDKLGATQINSGKNFVGDLLNITPGSPTDLVDSVPEPAAWALMIAGFGLVGVSLRRRRALVAA
jgi:choice-of-anchor A domain-containing protein